MLPVCSAMPCRPSFNQVISHVGSRMVYPLRKINEGRSFIDETQRSCVLVGNQVDMLFKTKATKFIYSEVMEIPDLAASQDPSTFPLYPNGFDDIIIGFPNGCVEKKHENLNVLASDVNNSCHLFANLNYVEDSDMLESYVQNQRLDSVSTNGINHGSTPWEVLSSQNVDPSVHADSKVEFAKLSDFLDQNLIGLSLSAPETLSASDAMTGSLPESQLVIPDKLEVVSRESPYLQKNIESFFSGIEGSVDKLLDRADKFVNAVFNVLNLSLSDRLKAVTETFDGAVSGLFSSIDNSKGEFNNQFTGFSVKLEKGPLKAGSIGVDILRSAIIGVERAISYGTTFVVYNYASAKTILPQDIRNLLNMFEDEVTRMLSPNGPTFRKVYEAIEEIERSLGFDPNDPLVPFLLLIGTTTAVGISYSFFRYDAFSLSPERTSELLKNDKNVVLVDVRPEALREKDGIPDLRREARSKYASIDLLEIDNSVRKLLKKGEETDNAVIAVLIRNLKNIKKGTKIIILDSDTGRSKIIARLLKKLGVKEPYMVQGGFQRWTREGLRFKKPKSETVLTILNEEVEAIFEDIKPSPVQVIGYGLGTLAAIYTLLEWEKTLQIIGIFCIGQTLYQRFTSYEDSEDLRRDVGSMLTPVTLGANAIYWIAGKLKPKRLRLPTTPSSVQDRVLQAAAKHESQPSDPKDNQGQTIESSGQANE